PPTPALSCARTSTPRICGKRRTYNPFRLRTYEKFSCKSFRIRPYRKWGVGVHGASRSAFWTPVKSHGLPPPEMQLRDVLPLSPFLATHPRPPGVLCRSLGCVPIFSRHSPLATHHSLFSHVLARPLCRACDGHPARLR